MPILQRISDVLHGHTHSTNTTTEPASSSIKTKPTFDHNKVTVIYVLGGPGAGKGTESEALVKEYDFVHLSAGDLLRAEQAREGSEHGKLIAEYIREGLVVPMEVTIKLLENAMLAALAERQSESEPRPGWENGKGRFLVDGFPRKMDQALKFDEDVCLASFVLFFNCPEEVLLQRLLERGKTSGRTDDNEESIKKRFKTFVDTSMPVVDHYRKQGKVIEIDSTPPPTVVHKAVKAVIDATFSITKSPVQE